MGWKESDCYCRRKTKFCCSSANDLAAKWHGSSIPEKGKNYFFLFLCGDIDSISGLTVNITELKRIGDILSLGGP